MKNYKVSRQMAMLLTIFLFAVTFQSCKVILILFPGIIVMKAYPHSRFREWISIYHLRHVSAIRCISLFQQ